MTTQNPPASRRRWPLYTTAAVLALLAAAAAWSLITRDDGFTITGTITVVDTDGNSLTVAGDNTLCRGEGGYTDLTDGTPVVVTDAAGAVVAIGAIDGLGTPTNEAGRVVECEFRFTVGGVPAGHDFYGVEVARRGRLTYPAGQLRRPLSLEIGR